MAALLKSYFEYEVNGVSSTKLDHNILHACYYGKMDELPRALEEQPESINAQDEHSGSTPLHIAASLGNYSMVKFLLNVEGIDLRIKNHKGNDAFDLAWQSGNRAVLQLIDQHQNPWKHMIPSDDPAP